MLGVIATPREILCFSRQGLGGKHSEEYVTKGDLTDGVEWIKKLDAYVFKKIKQN